MTKEQYICFLDPTRAAMPDDPTPEEAASISAHFAYYQGLHAQRTLILAGRTNEPPHVGIMIFAAESNAHAQAIVDADPAIAAGVFTARVQPYSVALIAEKTPQWSPAAAQNHSTDTKRYRLLTRLTLLFLSLIAIVQIVQTLFFLSMQIFVWENFWIEHTKVLSTIRITESFFWLIALIATGIFWFMARGSKPTAPIWMPIVAHAFALFLTVVFPLAWIIRELSYL